MARLRARRCRRRERQADAHRQPAAGRVVGDHRAAHRLDEAARDARARGRRPSAPRSSRRWNGSNSRSRCSPGRPARGRRSRASRCSAPANARDLDRAVAAAVAQRVVEHVDEHALAAARGRPAPAAGPRRRRRRRRPRGLGQGERARRRRPRRAPPAAACTLSAPAWRRLASSRLPTTASRRSAESSIVASSSSRSSLGPRRRRSGAGVLTPALIPASGVRRSWPTAASSAVRCASTAASARACSRLAAQPLALVGGPRGGGEGVEHALVLGEQRRAAADAAAAAGRAATSKRSGASLPAGAQPACSASIHSPLAGSRAFSATDSIPNVSRACRSTSCSESLLVEVGAGERRQRLGLGSRPARPRCARRTASSTAPLTSAATATKTTSATAWSGSRDRRAYAAARRRSS